MLRAETAKKIAEIIADELNLSLPEIAKYGRHGLVGKRSDTEIGIHSIRGGDIVGESQSYLCRTGRDA